MFREFGREVADLVCELTNIYKAKAYPELSRKERKALERDLLANVSPRAKLIKRPAQGGKDSQLVVRPFDCGKGIAEGDDFLAIVE
jgi:hypothetical protein